MIASNATIQALLHRAYKETTVVILAGGYETATVGGRKERRFTALTTIGDIPLWFYAYYACHFLPFRRIMVVGPACIQFPDRIESGATVYDSMINALQAVETPRVLFVSCDLALLEGRDVEEFFKQSVLQTAEERPIARLCLGTVPEADCNIILPGCKKTCARVAGEETAFASLCYAYLPASTEALGILRLLQQDRKSVPKMAWQLIRQAGVLPGLEMAFRYLATNKLNGWGSLLTLDHLEVFVSRLLKMPTLIHQFHRGGMAVDIDNPDRLYLARRELGESTREKMAALIREMHF